MDRGRQRALIATVGGSAGRRRLVRLHARHRGHRLVGARRLHVLVPGHRRRRAAPVRAEERRPAVRAVRRRRHRGLAPGQRGVLAAAAQGQPGSDARFDPSASTGFAVTLTDLGCGRVDVRRPRAVRPGESRSRTPRVTSRSPRRAARSASSRGARSRDLVRLGVTEQERDGVPRRQPRAVGRLPDPVGRLGRVQPEPGGRAGLELVPAASGWPGTPRRPTAPGLPDRGRRHQGRAQGRRPGRRALRGLGGHVQGQLVQRRQPLEDRRPPVLAVHAQRLPAGRRGDAQRHPRPDVRVGLRGDVRAGHRDARSRGRSTTCSSTARRSPAPTATVVAERRRPGRPAARPRTVAGDPDDDRRPAAAGGRHRRLRERRRHGAVAGTALRRRSPARSRSPAGTASGTTADRRRGHARDRRGRRRPHARPSTSTVDGRGRRHRAPKVVLNAVGAAYLDPT